MLIRYPLRRFEKKKSSEKEYRLRLQTVSSDTACVCLLRKQAVGRIDGSRGRFNMLKSILFLIEWRAAMA